MVWVLGALIGCQSDHQLSDLCETAGGVLVCAVEYSYPEAEEACRVGGSVLYLGEEDHPEAREAVLEVWEAVVDVTGEQASVWVGWPVDYDCPAMWRSGVVPADCEEPRAFVCNDRP